MNDKQDIYDRVTNKIVADLESGVLTWVQPWQIIKHAAGSITRPLRASGEKYRGINVLILWATALEKSYICPIWLTVQQGNKLGAYVKKGEKATYVFFFDKFKKTQVDKETGEATLKEIFYRGSNEQTAALGIGNPLPGEYTLNISTRELQADYKIFVSYTDENSRENQQVIKGTVALDEVQTRTIIINGTLELR